MKNLKQIQKLLSASKNELRKRYKVKEIGIFGSYVRNEQRKNSDIDILVETKKGISLFDFVGIKIELEEKLKK